MALGWINPEDYSFNSFLLLERFQIRLLMNLISQRTDRTEWRSSMGVALNANPVVKAYFVVRCPECAVLINEITDGEPTSVDSVDVRRAEIYCLASMEDFTIYTTPERMAEQCDFIRGWDKARLFDLADFAGKVVLDVGAGSGRLTFAAAEKAAWVYASEPVGILREFMREKCVLENIENVRVLDGFITELPFPDDTFDVVMSGHVLGDDWDREVAELARVCKNGGWLLNCPGDSERDLMPREELTICAVKPLASAMGI